MVLFKQCFWNIYIGMVSLNFDIFVDKKIEKTKNTKGNRGEIKRRFESNKMNNN